MTLFDSPSFRGHEGVHAFYDEATGLKAIIAVHSTARGPAVGGCRMWNYASSEEALTDVLRLSRGMSYKNAVADLEMGGGKSVIIGDAKTQKSPELFQAFGRAINTLGGCYYSAEDVGVSVADIAEARKATEYVLGLSDGPWGSGDPSPVTAEGVFRSTLVTAKRLWKQDDLNGLTVAVQGAAGHVGAYLAEKLHKAGARLIVTDINEKTLREVAERTNAEIVAPDAIYDVEADIYAPDYVVNGGGIINVASELTARQSGGTYDPAWVDGKLVRLMQTLEEVFERSAAENRPTYEVADAIAEARIKAAGEARCAR